MKFSLQFFTVVLIICILSSCSTKSDKPKEESNNSQNNHSTNSSENINKRYLNGTSDYSDQESEEESNNLSECNFEDGTYSATVDYNNSGTGYSATYTLDVDVQDCQVVQINFPNDGYLDGDHISYADIDQDGYAIVYGEEGKTYEISIDY